MAVKKANLIYYCCMALAKTKLSAGEIKELREKARKAISPLKPADKTHYYDMGATRTNAGRSLPDYYLVYFFHHRHAHLSLLQHADNLALRGNAFSSRQISLLQVRFCRKLPLKAC